MFSIVVPVWNKRPLIERTIAGVRAQSFRDFELILVDDGSTDGSLAAVGEGVPGRTRILRQANCGPGPARNAGIAVARGDWIAFLDADDIWLPDHLAELDRLRRARPDAGLIATSFLETDRDGRFAEPVAGAGKIGTIDYFARQAGGHPTFTTSSSAVSKRVVAALGGFGSARICQDLEYWARIALDWPVATSTRVTVAYRRGTGGICDSLKSPWVGRELRDARDLLAPVDMLIGRYPAIASAETRRSVDAYIDRCFTWCVRASALIGDVETMRVLPRLYLRPPPLADRALLALARLPRPVAWLSFRLAWRAKRLLRPLLPGLFRPAPAFREPGSAVAGRPTRAGG